MEQVWKLRDKDFETECCALMIFWVLGNSSKIFNVVLNRIFEYMQRGCQKEIFVSLSSGETSGCFRMQMTLRKPKDPPRHCAAEFDCLGLQRGVVSG